MQTNLFSLINNQFYADETPAAPVAEPVIDPATKAATDAAKVAGDEMFKNLNFSKEQQDFFSRTIAEERRRWQAQNQKTIDELKKLQAVAGTTQQQKDDLQKRIDDLQRQHMSKEELARQEQSQKEKEFQQQIQQQRTEAEAWRKKYNESTIIRALQDGAREFDAYNDAQIIDLLAPKTKLVEEVDATNSHTGNYVPRVQLAEYDSEGKLVVHDFTVKEALQKMRGMPERYGNLFKSTLAGGLGQSGSSNGGPKKKIDLKNMTPAEWQEYRKKDPNFTQVNQ